MILLEDDFLAVVLSGFDMVVLIKRSAACVGAVFAPAGATAKAVRKGGALEEAWWIDEKFGFDPLVIPELQPSRCVVGG